MSEKSGAKYFIDIEGTEHEWPRDVISVDEIRALGQIPSDQQIVEETGDGTEHTLQSNETIHLKPGHRYGRAPRYKRGA